MPLTAPDARLQTRPVLDEHPYPVLRSSVDPRDPVFETNRAANVAVLDQVRAALDKANAGGGPKYVERHRKRGRLLPRERIELLLDRDSPFLEIGALAGYVVYGGILWAAGWATTAPSGRWP